MLWPPSPMFLPAAQPLVVKSIAKFHKHLSWIIPVEASEGDAVVEFDAAVGDIEGAERGGEALAEIFAQGQIESGVLREIVSGIGLSGKGVGESRSVIDVGGGVGVVGQGEISAEVEGVALVVIQRSPVRIGKIGEPAIDESAGPGHLIGVGKMKLATVGDAGRAQRDLPSADSRILNGEREKEIGLADVVVIEKIGCVGAEGVGIENPSAPGNVDAELRFFVTLAVERDESEVVGIGELQERP